MTVQLDNATVRPAPLEAIEPTASVSAVRLPADPDRPGHRVRIWVEDGDPTEEGQAVIDLVRSAAPSVRARRWTFTVDVTFDGLRHPTLRRAPVRRATAGWLAVDRLDALTGAWVEVTRVDPSAPHARLTFGPDGLIRVRHPRHHGGRLEVIAVPGR